MVWEAISGIGGRLSLVFWDRKRQGRITVKSYHDHICLPHLLPLYPREHLFWGILLTVMEDNASGHNARFMQEVRETYLLPRLPWPAISSDLYPIEEI